MSYSLPLLQDKTVLKHPMRRLDQLAVASKKLVWASVHPSSYQSQIGHKRLQTTKSIQVYQYLPTISNQKLPHFSRFLPPKPPADHRPSCIQSLWPLEGRGPLLTAAALRPRQACNRAPVVQVSSVFLSLSTCVYISNKVCPLWYGVKVDLAQEKWLGFNPVENGSFDFQETTSTRLLRNRAGPFCHGSWCKSLLLSHFPPAREFKNKLACIHLFAKGGHTGHGETIKRRMNPANFNEAFPGEWILFQRSVRFLSQVVVAWMFSVFSGFLIIKFLIIKSGSRFGTFQQNGHLRIELVEVPPKFWDLQHLIPWLQPLFDCGSPFVPAGIGLADQRNFLPTCGGNPFYLTF